MMRSPMLTRSPLLGAALLSLLAVTCKKSAPVSTAEPPVASARALPTASASPLAVPTSAPPAPAEPLPITAAKAALVWQTSSAGFKTVWVEPGPKGVVVKRERQEPVVATQRALFAIRSKHGRIASLRAAPLGGGGALGLGSARVESCDKEETNEAVVDLVGAVGPIVFTRTHGWQQSCEAPHPQWLDTSNRIDLYLVGPLKLSPFPDLARLTAIAAVKFKAQFGDDGGGCLMAPKATPELYDGDFAYDVRGILRGHYTFTMESNYTCGTGPGHYTAAQEVLDSALPEPITFLKKAPAWLVPYLAKHPSVGVSPLPVELDAVEWAALFDSEPVPKP